MAIIVVHGVNTRADASFLAWKESISTFWRETIGELHIGGATVSGSPAFAYWGDKGVEFKWKMASLPKGDKEQYGSVTTFSTGAQELEISELHEVFNRPMPEALGLLADLVSLDPETYLMTELATLIASLQKAYLDNPEDPGFVELRQAKDDTEALGIIRSLVSTPNGHETYGAIAKAGLQSLGKLSTKLSNAASHRASSIFIDHYRGSLHRRGATFLGDLMKYLSVRKRDGGSEIQKAVLNAITVAQARDPNDPLILVGHSLGGVVLFDLIASGLINSAQIVLVTVGSQVSHFEEMNLLLDSDAKYPNSTDTKRPVPSAIVKWVNVYDKNDLFAFACAPIFDRVTDVNWSTKVGMLEAHGAYFFNPDFYTLIKKKLHS